MTETVTEKPSKPVVVSVTAARFKAAEYERGIYLVTPEYGTPFENLLNPGYWAHVSASLRPWDRIEVRPEDGSYFAELIVLVSGRLYAKVKPLRVVRLDDTDDAALAQPDEYEIKWSGPVVKHRVIRLSDNEVIQEHLATKEDAQAWLRDHLKALAL